MAEILHTVAVQEFAPAADGVQVHDLPVNALSVLLIGIRPLNDTGTLTDFAHYLELCGAFDRISVFHSGRAVVSMTGRDAAAMAWFRHGIQMPMLNAIDTTNFRRFAVLPIVLGRFPYDPLSCFPPSRRGELTLELDVDVADTGYDGLRYSVETIELLDVKPSHYEKTTQLTATLGATGDNDIDLPIGNVCRGVLAFGTTSVTGATPAPTLGRMALFLNNQQIGYSSVDFEVGHTLSCLQGRQIPSHNSHIHRVDATAAVATEPTTREHDTDRAGWENYAFLDLDPTRDDLFSVNTQNASRFHFRTDAEAANAVRVIAVERVAL